MLDALFLLDEFGLIGIMYVHIKMARTMGWGIQGDHVRPITSVRRKRRVHEDEEHVWHEVEETQPHVEVEDESNQYDSHSGSQH